MLFFEKLERFHVLFVLWWVSLMEPLEKFEDGVRWVLVDGQWVPEHVEAAEEVQEIPDYLEILKQKREQEKMEDAMIAQGKLPPHLALAEAKAEKKRQKAKQKNTGVLISGLPTNKTIDEDEFADWVTKFAGVIKKNPETRKRIVKFKKNDDGTFSGDVLVVFFRPESVQQVGGCLISFCLCFTLKIRHCRSWKGWSFCLAIR